MARVRTQKAVASRIDLNYHAKPHPWRTTRLTLVILCTLAAAGWFAWSSVRIQDGRLTLVDTIQNPGHVTGAHAMFETKCVECHDGGGNGAKGYWLNVSDNACLKCHDGSLHHENQKIADTNAGVSLVSNTLAVKDDGHPFKARSASCVSCHTEHRGAAALAATSDQHCTNCHADLTGKVRQGTPVVARTVALFSRDGSFSERDHPRFGRSLSDGGTWKDKTNLKFGHARHQSVIHKSLARTLNVPAGDPPTYLGRDCLTCHSVLNPQPERRDLGKIDKGDWENTPPPYVTTDDRSTEAINSSELRYMQPVSYAQHCVACHAVESPPKKAKELPRDKPGIDRCDFAHDDLSLVRGQVAALVQASLVGFEKSLKAAPPTTGGGHPGATGGRPGATPRPGAQPKEEAPAPARPGATPPRPGAAPSRPGAVRPGAQPADKPAEDAKPVELNATEWTRLQITLIANEANAALADIDAFKDQKLEVPAKPTGGTTQPSIDPAILVDYYTTLVAAKNCYTCHSLEGELPTLDAARNAAMTNRLRTVATGIPRSPRRWFSAGQFDHYAHRQVSCQDCHAPAWQSGASASGAEALAFTAQLLTCDIDGSYPGAAGLAVTSSTRSCVSCHHSDVGANRGAPSNCVTCHDYHDHALERPIDGMRATTSTPTQTPKPATAVAEGG